MMHTQTNNRIEEAKAVKGVPQQGVKLLLMLAADGLLINIL